jgi:hypothetical protein
LLGAPLGSDAFVQNEIRKKITKVKETTDMLPLLEDPHIEYVLLKSCLSLPKLSFLLRTVDTCGFTEELRSFDRITREALNRILGTPLDSRSWHQAKLPTTMGGAGLRAAEDHAPAAFAASLLSSQPLVQALLGPGDQGHPQVEGDNQEPSILSPLLLDTLSAAQGSQVVEAELEGLTQHMISLQIDQEQQRRLHNMFDEDETREKARLASLALAHSGDWLSCAPIKSLGLHLRPSEFVMALKYRLGVPIYASQGPCPACLRLSDRHGDHALCCGTGGERISRHNSLRDAFFDVAVSAGLSPTKEGRFLLPGVDRRPADVLLPHWEAGLDAALDITVVTSLQAATVARAAEEPGFALEFAHERKLRGAEDLCRQQGLAFLPLVAEALGAWHPSAQKQVKKLGSALARHTGQPDGEATGHLWQRLGVLLQRGNANLFNNRIPNHPEPQVDGLL